METGLATYALRVLESTSDYVDWTVAYPPGCDPESLPANVRGMSIEMLDKADMPAARIFQIGNSSHCFPVVQALYKFGGTALFHEIVLHHMLRHCYLESNRMEDYRRELKFCCGPAAEAVEKDLSAANIPVEEFDIKLKRYPLIGRTVNASHSAVCLNSFAASKLKYSYPEGRILTIGHPLTTLPELEIPPKPFSLCFGMVGTNHTGRNLESLVEAVELLRDDYPEAGLVLIGADYPEGLPEWVMRTGRLTEKEYQGWIRTLDYVFDLRHPTCGETSGSLLEAMRAGIPSIVTATGSFNNLPSDAVIRVSPNAIVQATRAAILLLESKKDLRNSISRNAASYANDTGSEERLRSDWKKVLRLAGKHSADDYAVRSSNSISPAWHEPPQGFVRNLDTMPVTWKFSGNVKLEGPECSSGAVVTAWGEGTAGNIKLKNKPSVVNIDGRVLRFSGNGWISNVYWK